MWVFNIELNDQTCGIDLKTLQNRLYKKGIETRPAFVPINEQRALIKIFPKKIIKNSCPNASKLMKGGFYLPSGNNLKNNEIDYICEQLVCQAQPGDSILVMSNGGFGGIHDKVLQALSKKWK